MTAWTGASRGGRISPWSSPWVMIMAPMKRMLNPQEVVQTYCWVLFSSRNWILKALAKFCPRKCDVPACRALPSCIKASIAYVSRAPANLSPGDFTPLRTGIAIQFSAKSAYTSNMVSASFTASSFVISPLTANIILPGRKNLSWNLIKSSRSILASDLYEGKRPRKSL